METLTSFDALRGLILQKFDDLVALVEAAPAERLNLTLPLPGSNSLAQLLVHCCGMARRWSSTVNLGVPVPRNREAEFAAVVARTDLLALAAATRSALAADLSVSEPEFAPRGGAPEGRDESWLPTQAGVLMHVLEELSQHLGHAEVTRDVLEAGLVRP